MRTFYIILLAAALVALQYRLWVGKGSLAEVHALHKQLNTEKQALQVLRQQNTHLRAEVRSLQQEDAAIEARARMELGMIRSGETYFQLVRRPRLSE